MPGKSRRGGGLESSPIYKKQSYGEAKSPFMMKGSPFKQAIGGGAGEALTHWEKFKKRAKKVVKKGKKVVKTGVKRNPYVAIASMLFGKSAKATQPGTGTHGGTKVPKLRDIDKK